MNTPAPTNPQDASNNLVVNEKENHRFSFFRKPIRNIKPERDITIHEIYEYIIGLSAKQQTEQLRSITDKEVARKYKAENFDFCTFSGTFNVRNRKELISHSGLLCIDFDHIDDIPSLKEKLLKDECFRTELLFRSPSGDGLKWIISIDLEGMEHSLFYRSVYNYLVSNGYPEPDKSGSDVSRSCFIPHDPDAYMNQDAMACPDKKFHAKDWQYIPGNGSATDKHDSTINSLRHSTSTPYYIEGGEDTKEKVERIVDAIELSGTDLTENYEDWIKVGFAIASELGEEGRRFFHRVSQQSIKYNQQETDAKYDNFLNSSGSGVNIGSFFQIAKDAGIDISNKKGESNCHSGHTNGTLAIPVHSRIKSIGSSLLDFRFSGSEDKEGCSTEPPTDVQNTRNPEIQADEDASAWILDEKDLPHFPDFIYRSLPPFLQNIIETNNSEDERDMLLMGSLTCLSVTLTNVYGMYKDDYWNPMLYFFVLAEAGMSKGTLNYSRQLVAPINNEIHERSEQLIKEYREAVAQAKVKKSQGNVKKGASKDNSSTSALTEEEKKARWDMIYEELEMSDRATSSDTSDNNIIEGIGEEPKRRTLFIPTNSSASAFIEQLDNNCGIGLLFDTECDTLSAVLKSDYGDYSSFLRKGFHHEPIDMSRRKESEYRIIDHPMIALCLSGTPKQLHTLTPSAENGLFSRILYYHIPFKVSFADALKEDKCIDLPMSGSKRNRFFQLGIKYKMMREAFLRGGEYRFVVPQRLCDVFNTHYRTTNKEAVDNVADDLQAVIRRIAFSVFRIMMVISSIRFMDENPNPSALAKKGMPIKITCTEEDFRIAMAIGDTLVYHSIYCFVNLPNNMSNPLPVIKIPTIKDKMNSLYDALPDTFDKPQYASISARLNFSASTTSKWINKFIQEGRLIRQGQNCYQKNHHSIISSI